MFDLAAIVAGSLAAAGAWVARRGWRGRRFDDHPLCRRCGFDLTGRPATTSRCGECGADLSRRRAVRVGHRRRRPAVVAAGVLLSAAAVALGLRQSTWYARVDRHKPVWLLAAEIRHGGLPRAMRAAHELQRRLDETRDRKDLPPDAEGWAIADAVLDRQADAGKGWDNSLGNLFISVPVGNMGARWGRFLLQAASVHLRVRPTVRQGDLVPAELAIRTGRAYWGIVEGVGVEATADPAVADVAMSVQATAEGERSIQSNLQEAETATFFHVRLPVGWDGRVPLGPHHLSIRVHCRSESGSVDQPADASADTMLSADVTVVAADQDTIRPADAAFTDLLKRQLWFEANPGSKLGRVYLIPRLDGPLPGSYRFAAFARQGGRERPLGEVRSLRGGPALGGGDLDVGGLSLTQMMPLLRCPPGMARDTVDQVMYLPADVVLRGPITLDR